MGRCLSPIRHDSDRANVGQRIALASKHSTTLPRYKLIVFSSFDLIMGGASSIPAYDCWYLVSIYKCAQNEPQEAVIVVYPKTFISRLIAIQWSCSS
ncbi:hypothetical protein GUJ93_ZPchr0013g35874 [Zizania palustris]|uniref:Uncharacterized protein n=1 Tax=Zizania palustris TaxID=103762 RepID=A0A8J5WX57_ZIZPA|nr:hypothetical protein GUJ93_ZPchr0013g35874 [Zizania palustris]